MKTFRLPSLPSLSAFALAALAAAAHTAPAQAAGGRSGANAAMPQAQIQDAGQKSQMQAQIDALRKEVEALKTAMAKNPVAAQ
jgi:TolA-binding protein